ncbi:TolC family protein [Flavisphingomonas formosensis]|uniref:TolC family protein n=1 Tax=Flavisphingomonas formosensis TaxID=861534 RepID=UPI0018DF70EC|nr:TolC family protein [Sphingomonas formosensis]
MPAPVPMAPAALMGPAAPASGPSAPAPSVPPPGDDPMAIDFATDPILGFGHREASPDLFRATIARAIGTHPSVRRASAAQRQANAAVKEAHSGWLPEVDLQMTYNRRLAAGFSNRFTDTLVEQTQPVSRTDASVSVSQKIFDFGATAQRVKGAKARRDQAGANLEIAQDDLALDAIAAWYDVAAYRALVALAESMQQSEKEIRGSVAERIKQGASSAGDLSRVDVYLGRVALRLTQLHGQLASAEARYRESTGMPAPMQLGRPTLTLRLPETVEEARLASGNAPEVRSAKAQERAARADWRAVQAENLPQVGAQVNAARYGILENRRDYDVRGQVTLSHRLFGGGGGARQEQAHEQYRGAQAASDQVIGEAERDAETAFYTLVAYDEQVKTLEQSYIANRRNRDVLYTRFKNLNGTLFDILVADDDYFDTATTYLTAVAQRDAQRLALLRKCGTLLEGLNITMVGPGR